MRQAILISTLLTTLTIPAGSQQPAAKVVHPAAKSPAARPEAAANSELPVTRVSLYKNGVGFFEHSGRVTGNQSVTIDFTTAQLNDVLQSLTAIDLNGGRIAGAGYNSTTPLEQQLKALPLSLSEDPTDVDFYQAIRGARVAVSAPGVSVTGRLLAIDLRDRDAKPADSPAQASPNSSRRFITVVSETGQIRTVELTPATSVTLLDTALHTDVSRYLELLASTRNQGLRHLTLEDNAPVTGTGPRELHVSYISEVPIWKSTYRILFTNPKDAATPAKQTATLQGWSVVDNTTGTDWVNVHLSIIAGAPQSFIQPLSVPYYSRRPEIGLPQEAQLTPQTHESGDVAEDKTAQVAGVAGMQGMGSGFAGGSANGLVAGSGGNYGGSVMARSAPRPSAATSADALDIATGTVGGSINGELYQSLASNSIAPRTNTAAFDDYFAYNLSEPITIRKNESALVPILQTEVDAERVTLVSFAAGPLRQPTPLRALWITNTSNLTLDRGSFTIVEDGNFGGEGLLDPIHPAEKRLLSYAIDQAVRVTTESEHNTTHATELTAAKGVLVLHHTQIAEVTYVVHNAAADSRTVIVEHPIHPNFVLDNASGENGQDPKPEETTPTVYRYRVVTAPGATVRLHVGERHRSVVSYQLTNFNDNQLTFILNQSNNSAAIKQALEPILDARRHVSDMQQAVDKVNSRLSTLRSDEDRQRSNITALANADKVSRERFVRDLNATEDQIAAAQKDLTTAQSNLQAAKDSLAAKIESLQIDEQI